MFDKTTIPKLAAALQGGGIAVIPTDTIYGIVAKAQDRSAVEKLYRLKQRTPTKPFIILISNLHEVEDFGVVLTNTQKLQLAQYWPGPVSVVLECNNSAFQYLHRGTNSLAFRLPDNQNLQELLKLTGPLVAPSANTEGHIAATTIEEAESYFPEGVDMFLKGPTNQTASKIISLINDDLKVIRP